MKKLCLFIVFALGISICSLAQNFRAKQKSQERVITTAYKKGRITEREYAKLMHEQDIIKETLYKYKDDDHLTPHEKNVIHSKLERAEKRLIRYKRNGEVY